MTSQLVDIDGKERFGRHMRKHPRLRWEEQNLWNGRDDREGIDRPRSVRTVRVVDPGAAVGGARDRNTVRVSVNKRGDFFVLSTLVVMP